MQLKPGGLVRVHTSALQPSSQYKSLVISEETTSDELLGLLLSCYNSTEPIEQFSLYEVCPGQEYQRKLHPDDIPLRSQTKKQQRGDVSHFLVRRNPNYPRRRQFLPPINEMLVSSTNSLSTPTNSDNIHISNSSNYLTNTNSTNNKNDSPPEVCQKCRNNFKSCDFCHKLPPPNVTLTYNPVYSMREIRSVCNAFSAFGIDKKLMDFENSTRNYSALNNRYSYRSNTNTNDINEKTATPTPVLDKESDEALSENTLKGLRNFQYV